MQDFTYEAGISMPPSLQSIYLFAFDGNELLYTIAGDLPQCPLYLDYERYKNDIEDVFYLGKYNGADCLGARWIKGHSYPKAVVSGTLRSLFNKTPDSLLMLAGKVQHLLHWDSLHRYCGKCGSITENHPTERAKRCTSCGQTAYPRISPAIIVSITKGDKLLLARSNRFPMPMYSVLAGFVEPGETLEECVKREVMEEVGISVNNIRYFGSQPWPFPDSLMVGFTAEYEHGEIAPDPEEIMDANWFSMADFPMIPSSISIARKLIDAFVNTYKK